MNKNPRIVDSTILSRYKSHKDNWIDCDRCPLHNHRKQVVLFRGRIPCDVLFIGEAPGASEDTLGLPFVGPSGDFLGNMIEEAQATAAVPRNRPFSVAFTNVVGCRPLDVSDTASGQDREPLKTEIEACKPRVFSFTRIANPKLLVLLGKVAKKSVPTASLEGVTVLELVHPSAILRAVDSDAELMRKRFILTLADALKRIA